MSKKGNLFFLIKSLTKSEKRYFKIFCFSQKVGKNYLKLFEAYDKMEVLDEALIKEKFKNEKFVVQLHVTKNYLSNLILAALRNYHSKFSKAAELKDCLRNVEILFSKELYDQCYYELQKAERIALEYERPTSQLEVLNWRRRLILAKKGFQKEDLLELVQSENVAIQQLEQLNKNWSLLAKVFDFINDVEGSILKKELKENSKQYETLQSKTLFHHFLYTYYTINSKPEKAKINLLELIELLEAHPNRIVEDPGSYMTALNNLVGFYLFQKDYEAAYPILQKVKDIPEKYNLRQESKFTLKLQLRTHNVELEIYRDTQQWQKGIELIEARTEFLEKNRKIIPEVYLLQLWYQFSYIYFMAKDYNNALKWVNEILNFKFGKERKDLQSYARILNLMIHLELGNSFVLKYAVESTRRWLRKQKTIEPFEKVLLKFFSKISNTAKGDFRSMFRKLSSDLFYGEEPLITENVLDYLDFRGWVEERS